MRAEKGMRIGELNEIAQRYVSGTNRYKKKIDVYKDIKLRFEAHISGDRRLGAASENF